MEKRKLIEKVNQVLADEFEIETADILPNGEIKEVLQLDSLSLVDLVALVEETFGVSIKGTEVVNIKTFEALYDFIYERMDK
jgi:acyl carrier protein